MILLAKADSGTTITFRESVTRADCDNALDGLDAETPRAVQLVCDLASPGALWATAIADRYFPSVKAFIFDTHFQSAAHQRDNSIGDLAITARALPNVEQLFAAGAITTTPFEHQILRELYLVGDPLPTSCLAGLAASTLPRLERLALSLSAERPPPESADILQRPSLGLIRSSLGLSPMTASLVA
jgi:hypothetical protein